MARFAIVCKPGKRELKRILPELIVWLRARGHEPVLDSQGGKYTDGAPSLSCEELAKSQPDLVIVLGGDGTLLGAARAFGPTGIPLLSVNLGHLGFLSEVRLADLYNAIESWLAGSHLIDTRSMLHAELWRDGALETSCEALNDAVVFKGEVSRMSKFLVEQDGRKVARFRADGVMVSTPTGSTAYNMAANGPILTPDVDALVVTPINPHLLTLRPLVVPGDTLLTMRVEGAQHKALFSIDGLAPIEFGARDEVRCRRSVQVVNLVRLSNGAFFDALRSKLSWGEL
jgi:NAD+ kinase